MSLCYSSQQWSVPQEATLQLEGNLELESGTILQRPIFAYQTWGKLNADKSNVVWVCHALTGNHRVQEWWNGLFGKGKCFDPEAYFIVSVNTLGSCYGSTGPLSFRACEKRYFTDFPLITIRDMVKGLEAVRQVLGLEKIQFLIGASVGGQQALEWAVQQPYLFDYLIPIATNAVHSPFGIAFNEAQRLAIEADETFYHNDYNGGRKGLIAARAIGMLSYRTYEGYALTQQETTNEKSDQFRASSYQRYQGEKLAARFNAYSYWYLSKAMDSHNLARGRKSIAEVLSAVAIPSLVVGIDSDLLFPLQEQAFLAQCLPKGRLITLSSAFGHDGFLVEFDQLTQQIKAFLAEENDRSSSTQVSA
jgi:homoserine O-acetyltransferase/O-succinyltransferase